MGVKRYEGEKYFIEVESKSFPDRILFTIKALDRTSGGCSQINELNGILNEFIEEDDDSHVRSQQAIERLGAVREAMLRKHMIVRDNYQRDSFVYSIIDEEWQELKSKLEGFLNR